jgi:hypothetical protein
VCYIPYRSDHDDDDDDDDRAYVSLVTTNWNNSLLLPKAARKSILFVGDVHVHENAKSSLHNDKREM